MSAHRIVRTGRLPCMPCTTPRPARLLPLWLAVLQLQLRQVQPDWQLPAVRREQGYKQGMPGGELARLACWPSISPGLPAAACPLDITWLLCVCCWPTCPPPLHPIMQPGYELNGRGGCRVICPLVVSPLPPHNCAVSMAAAPAHPGSCFSCPGLPQRTLYAALQACISAHGPMPPCALAPHAPINHAWLRAPSPCRTARCAPATGCASSATPATSSCRPPTAASACPSASFPTARGEGQGWERVGTGEGASRREAWTLFAGATGAGRQGGAHKLPAHNCAQPPIAGASLARQAGSASPARPGSCLAPTRPPAPAAPRAEVPTCRLCCKLAQPNAGVMPACPPPPHLLLHSCVNRTFIC